MDMVKITESLKQFDFAKLQEKVTPILTEQSYVVDLVLVLTNLISIEEHFVFTGAKTHQTAYYDLIKNVQVMSRKLFGYLKMPPALEAVGRNLLATSMRLMEVGTKQWSLNQPTIAQDFFQRAYELHLLFCSVNLKLITPNELKPLDAELFAALDEYLTELKNNQPQVVKKTPLAATARQMVPFKDLNEFIEKIDSLKKQNRLDLSSDQDLTLGIMNLVNLEEEFFLLGAQSKHKDYYDLLFKVREMRKVLLQMIIQQYEGEVWCIAKHLLAAAMRCMQAGFKLIAQNEAKLAYELFQFAYDLYALFWGLNLGVVGQDAAYKPQGFLEKLGALVKKAIDCCIE